MSEREWFWYVGSSEERCEGGPFASREEAVAEALGQGIYRELDPDEERPEWRISFHVVEARKHAVQEIVVPGDRVIEWLEDGRQCAGWLDPEDSDGLFPTTTREQDASLTRRLSEALHAWVRDNDIPFRPWAFAETRNEEDVVLPHPDNEPAL